MRVRRQPPLRSVARVSRRPGRSRWSAPRCSLSRGRLPTPAPRQRTLHRRGVNNSTLIRSTIMFNNVGVSRVLIQLCVAGMLAAGEAHAGPVETCLADCTPECGDVCSGSRNARCLQECRATYAACRAACLRIPKPVCVPGSVEPCQPAAGACGQKTCGADGSPGACTQISCGVCTPGAKQACDYRGSAGSSHCELGEQTCNSLGSGFGACADPGYRCGRWGNIDFKECASTGVANMLGNRYTEWRQQTSLRSEPPSERLGGRHERQGLFG